MVTTRLHVLDVNEHAPSFHSQPYVVHVAENTPPHSSLVQLMADDPDAGTNGEVRYSLAPDGEGVEAASALFAVDPYTGWVSTLAPLDREARAEHRVALLASDAGSPRRVARGTLLRASGELLVARPLDRELTPSYDLVLAASDGKFTAQTDLHIDVLDVNDNPPYCLRHRYWARLPEDAANGTLVMTLATGDADEPGAARLRYYLTGDAAHHFVILKESGEVRVAAALDREARAAYVLRAHAQDRERADWECSSELRVQLDDVNDNAPAFSAPLYSVTLPEDADLGTLVAKVHATDPDLGENRLVRYSFVEEPSGAFELAADSGIVTLRAPLDRETQAEHRLLLRATDAGTPPRSATATLRLTVADVNDNPPEFEFHQYRAAVPELDAPGTQVLRVRATSRDAGVNADVYYSLVGGDDRDDFAVDRASGVVSVARPLDYERRRQYLLTVQAVDGGTPPLSDLATLNITVGDGNDNAPQFTQAAYSARVPEDAAPGTRVLQLVADDADSGANGRVSYSVARGDRDARFSLDPDTGYLCVAAPLDREAAPAHVLTVRARDHGLPALEASASVNIEVLDANDNPPLFAQSNYTAVVQEDRPLGHTILKFVVEDADAPPNGAPYTFDFQSGNEMGAFRLEQDGYLRSATRFNHRIKDRYVLQIRVFDNGTPPLYSDAWVYIRVIEESQYPPVVTPLEVVVNSYLDEFPGGIIGRVFASDRDAYDTLTYSIVPIDGAPYPPTDLFEIDSADGTLKAAPRLDVGEYRLNVTVDDGKFLGFAIIKVSVILISDEMLAQTVVVRFREVTDRDFILSHRKGFIRAIGEATDCEPGDVVIVSVQPAGESGELGDPGDPGQPGQPSRARRQVAQDLDVAVAVRAGAAFLPADALVSAAARAPGAPGGALAPRGGGAAPRAPAPPACTAPAPSAWRCCPRRAPPPARCSRSWRRRTACAPPAPARPATAASAATRPPAPTAARRPWRSWPATATCCCAWSAAPCRARACWTTSWRCRCASARAASAARCCRRRAAWTTPRSRWRGLPAVPHGARLGPGAGARRRARGRRAVARGAARRGAAQHAPHRGPAQRAGADAAPAAVLDVRADRLVIGAALQRHAHAFAAEQVTYGFHGCISDVKLGGAALPLEEGGTSSDGRAQLLRPRARARGQRLRRAAAAHALRLVPVPQRRHVPRRGGPAGGRGRGRGLRVRVPRALLGRRCELDADPCASQPCLHGGSCAADARGWRCACAAGWRASAASAGAGAARACARTAARAREGEWGPSCRCRRVLRAALPVRRGRVRGRALPQRRHVRQRARLLSLSLPAGQDRCVDKLAPRASKLSNLEAVRRERPASCAEPPPLNNVDTLRSYGSAGDELEGIPPDYRRNLNIDVVAASPVDSYSSCVDKLARARGQAVELEAVRRERPRLVAAEPPPLNNVDTLRRLRLGRRRARGHPADYRRNLRHRRRRPQSLILKGCKSRIRRASPACGPPRPLPHRGPQGHVEAALLGGLPLGLLRLVAGRRRAGRQSAEVAASERPDSSSPKPTLARHRRRQSTPTAAQSRRAPSAQPRTRHCDAQPLSSTGAALRRTIDHCGAHALREPPTAPSLITDAGAGIAAGGDDDVRQRSCRPTLLSEIEESDAEERAPVCAPARDTTLYGTCDAGALLPLGADPPARRRTPRAPRRPAARAPAPPRARTPARPRGL
uniref:Uncharacterized protein n=1 Tax=Heliothis virescens TaxID=7102 RepID=A0A2A4JWE1_HELVI